MHPNQDLPGPGDRFGAAFDDDLIEPTWGFNGGNLHGMFVSVPWNSDYEHTKAAQQDQRPCDRDCIRFVTNVRANAWVQLPLLERPEVEAAVAGMAEAGAESRGAVFTRREVVDFILDLAGYTTNKPLHKARVLEPSMGQGDFLTPVIDRLFEAYTRQKT